MQIIRKSEKRKINMCRRKLLRIFWTTKIYQTRWNETRLLRNLDLKNLECIFFLKKTCIYISMLLFGKLRLHSVRPYYLIFMQQTVQNNWVNWPVACQIYKRDGKEQNIIEWWSDYFMNRIIYFIIMANREVLFWLLSPLCPWIEYGFCHTHSHKYKHTKMCMMHTYIFIRDRKQPGLIKRSW